MVTLCIDVAKKDTTLDLFDVLQFKPQNCGQDTYFIVNDDYTSLSVWS